MLAKNSQDHELDTGLTGGTSPQEPPGDDTALTRLRDEVSQLLQVHTDPETKPPFTMMELLTIGAIMQGKLCLNGRQNAESAVTIFPFYTRAVIKFWSKHRMADPWRKGFQIAEDVDTVLPGFTETIARWDLPLVVHLVFKATCDYVDDGTHGV